MALGAARRRCVTGGAGWRRWGPGMGSVLGRGKAVAPCTGLGPAQSVGGVTAEWSESNVVTAAVRRGVTFVLSRTH